MAIFKTTLGREHDAATLQAIGELAVRFGELEHILKLCLKTLVNADYAVGMTIGANMGVREVMNVVGALCSLRFGEGELAASTRAFLKRADTFLDERNELLHALVAVTKDGKAIRVHRKTRRTGAKATIRPVQVAELKGLSVQISKLVADIQAQRSAWMKALGVGENVTSGKACALHSSD